MTKVVGAAEFKAKCLRLINDMRENGEPVTITKRGRAVAVLSPVSHAVDRTSILGALQGSVLAYDDPFLPAQSSNISRPRQATSSPHSGTSRRNESPAKR